MTSERERKLKMENDVRAGLLVSVHDVAKEAFESERIIREGILNIPARLAAELAAERDAGQNFLPLDQALRAALTATADWLEASAKRLADEGGHGAAAVM